MTIPSVWLTLLVILSFSLLENVDAQSKLFKTGREVIESLENLSKAMATLQTRMELHTVTLSNLEAKAVLQEALLNYLSTTAGTQASLLNNLETKIHVQAKSLSNLEVQSNMQISSLYKLEANLEIQANALKNFVTKEEWQEPIAQSPVNRTIQALEGDNVEIWCVIRGTPLPEIQWTRENGTVESDRVTVENNGKTLRFKNVQINDEGSYVCVASNGVGAPATQSVSLEVYGKYRKCNRMIEADKGNLEIEPSNSSCLCVIKLQNTTGFRLELDPLMTESILVIPEQNASNSSAQSIWINGSKNVSSYEFEGQKLVIEVPPRRERTTLNWRGLATNVSEMKCSEKLVKESEGTLEWEPMYDGTHTIFWEIVLEHSGQLNWTLNTASTASHQESPCENMYFSILQVRPDGNISEIERTCNGSSDGSLKLESNSRVLVLLQVKSVDAAKSKLQVTWKYYGEPLKKNTEGIVVGTNPGGAVVIPFNSTQTKTSSSKDVDGLAFDWNSRRIYWLEHGVGILRAKWDGRQSEVLLSDTSSSLVGMAIEPISGNIYFGNKSSKAIRVCDTNASKCSTIANNSDFSSIEDLAVHWSKGFLFWSIWEQKIVRANLDGSNAKVILQRNVTRIDVDENEDRLYWGSRNGIGSCDLNGEDIRMVPNQSTDVTDVAIDEENVYYGDWITKSIKVTSKLGTNSRQIANLTVTFYHLTLFGTQDPNQPPNPCEKSQCAHLCSLITPRSYRCLCPDNQELNPNGKTCKL